MIKAREQVVRVLREGGFPAIETRAGARIQLDTYADMAVRSVAQSAHNLAGLDCARAMGSDLIRISSHEGSCPVCAPYQGRVYSISGNDKRFPYLYRTPISRMYHTFHPNCRHVLYPVAADTYTKAELDEMSAYANRSFEPGGTGWTQAQTKAYERSARAYQTGQAKKVAMYQDKKQWERYRAVLGKEAPGTLSGFRRVKSGEQWPELQKKYREANKQFTSGGSGGRISVKAEEQLVRIPELAASRITRKIESGEYSTKISHQQYLKHVEGTAQYEQYEQTRAAKGKSPQSVLTISEDEAQKMILDKAGTGIIETTFAGDVLPAESITADRIIGKTWSGGRFIETNKARIYYSKRGSHIVPIGGFDYD